MTQIAAICKALLAGETLSMMDGFKKFACTNISRELSRSVEKKFGLSICKEDVKFTSQYGQPGHYFRYRLNPLREGNKEAIEKMLAYIKENGGGDPPKTHAEEKQQSRINQTMMAAGIHGKQTNLFN